MTIFIGRGPPGERRRVYWIDEQGAHVLDLRHDLANHSPDGAEWGYGGSGPAQLALGIVAHVARHDREALACYQQFKREVVQRFNPDCGWILSEDAVRAWLAGWLRGERVQVWWTPLSAHLLDLDAPRG